VSADPGRTPRLSLRSDRPVPGAVQDGGRELPAADEQRLSSLCESPSTALAAAPDGNRIAVVCDGVVRLWDLRPAPGGWKGGVGRQSLPFSGVSTVFAAGPGTVPPLAVGYAGGDAEIYDPGTGKTARLPRPMGLLGIDLGQLTLTAPGPGVSALAWSPDGLRLHVFGQDGLWRIHDRTGGVVETHWTGGRVCAAVVSADGLWLARLVEVIAGQNLVEVLPVSGEGEPVVRQMWSNIADRCRAGLAFHPTRTELAIGSRTEVTLWKPSEKGAWQSRRVAEATGRIFAAAWANDLLAVGGAAPTPGDDPGEDGFVDLLNPDGTPRHLWKIPGSPVSGLASEPGGRRLAASTGGGSLSIWNVSAPEALPTVLTAPDGSIDSPAFLDPQRVAALTMNGVSAWPLGTAALADTFCATAAANLRSNDWTNFVDPSLDRYELACPDPEHGLGPHPSVLSEADILAQSGNATAERIYRRLNELQKGIVVNPARRARGQRLSQELSGFDAADRQGILDGMSRAQEYDDLRRAEGLLPLSLQPSLRLCRRGAVLGEARRALPFCENAVELLPRDGYAHDSRGLARAVLGDLRGAREDFSAALAGLTDADRQKRQDWLRSLDAGHNPITPEVLREIAREELGVEAAPPPPS